MGRSVPTSDDHITITVIDAHHPHLVFGVPVSFLTETVDVLYIDILEDKAPPYMFEFIQAVARHIHFAHESLLLVEAKINRQVVDQHLTLAREIQSKLIPRELDQIPTTDLAFVYRPALWVGGDYLDVWQLQDGRIALAIGDVSGKGIGAAIIMSNLHAALRTTLQFCFDINRVTQQINEHLIRTTPIGKFVTLFLGLFDPSTHQLTYVNAGHPTPIIFGGTAGSEFLGQPSNPPLGISEDIIFTSHITSLLHHSGIMVFTDGITEAKSPDDQEYGSHRIKNMMGVSIFHTAQDVIQSVLGDLKDFCQPSRQYDDLTLLVLLTELLQS